MVHDSPSVQLLASCRFLNVRKDLSHPVHWDHRVNKSSCAVWICSTWTLLPLSSSSPRFVYRHIFHYNVVRMTQDAFTGDWTLVGAGLTTWVWTIGSDTACWNLQSFTKATHYLSYHHWEDDGVHMNRRNAQHTTRDDVWQTGQQCLLFCNIPVDIQLDLTFLCKLRNSGLCMMYSWKNINGGLFCQLLLAVSPAICCPLQEERSQFHFLSVSHKNRLSLCTRLMDSLLWKKDFMFKDTTLFQVISWLEIASSRFSIDVHTYVYT